jgi:amicyanin
MKRVILSAVVATLLALSLGLSKAGCKLLAAKPVASGQTTSNGQYQVKIDNFSFGPATLTVSVGATVTWINQDDVPHNVVSTDGKDIKSPVLDTDQKFSYTFTKAGTYDYYCKIHPMMTAKVIVQ